ncbi:MAG: phosphohistidine phosphatase, SixA [Candidatus Angelobacter sp.]|nr:phosphohistidine phosphatase, SixA [Candidatus Angelobacter sp.]
MLLYFLRHASAGKTILSPRKDERRPLDEEGILQARYVGRLLANLDVQVDQIISSPLIRARQTASLVANELAFEAAVQIDDALRPEAEFEQFQAMLARYKRYDAVMVVGHNPSFTEFLSKSISAGSGAAQIDFKKGAVARVEMNGRAGQLHWLVTPKIARTLQTSLKSSSRPKTSRK